MFVLAHLSDPHLAPLLTARLRDLAGKRLLGYVNWRRNRHKVHRTEQVDMLVRDLKSRGPDYVAVTGGLVNIALEAEFAQARAWLHGLGSPHDVTLVPGNHDAYVRPALAAQATYWHEFMRDDGATTPALRFPFVRRRGSLALIGLSRPVPTAPVMATGRLGGKQIERLEDILGRLTGLCRVVVIHHPLFGEPGDRFKRLGDAADLAVVRRRFRAAMGLHRPASGHRLNLLHGPR